jgi:predicted secreted protein
MGGSSWKTKLAGLADYTIKIGGNFDLSDAQQAALQAAVLTNPGATITWKIYPSGTGAAYSGTALVKTEGIKFAVSSEEQVTFDLEGNGALTYA